MPPTNPWGKKNELQLQTSASGFPELKPSKSNEAAAKDNQKSQYEEIQEEEVFALSAIYAEDFKRIDNNRGAWKVISLDEIESPC